MKYKCSSCKHEFEEPSDMKRYFKEETIDRIYTFEEFFCPQCGIENFTFISWIRK